MEQEKVSEVLKERNEKREEKVVEKGLGYVPYNVYSFDELDAAETACEIKEEYQELFYQFVQIADNIMWERPDNFEDYLLNLTKDFGNRLMSIKLMAGQMLKSGSVSLFKSNDQLQWIGVPTNKFQDREKDILSDAAHRKFVKMLKSGEAKMPDLYPWHTGKIGETTWVDYDERGFLVAGGHILKEYENFAIQLLMNTDEPMGMSHGMWSTDIKRDTDGTIIEYKSFEFSFLPQSKAANLLTSFTADKI